MGADLLTRFLAFIVEETIGGRGEFLNEFMVSVEIRGQNPRMSLLWGNPQFRACS
ncbi:MAG: hypothetical protein WBY44_18900 [Bryobacteraceae bacterium]|jgi:hypothetical protein